MGDKKYYSKFINIKTIIDRTINNDTLINENNNLINISEEKNDKDDIEELKILVTGATGFLGGRLFEILYRGNFNDDDKNIIDHIDIPLFNNERNFVITKL